MTSILCLKCSAEAQKAIGRRKESLAEAQVGPALLGNWFAHRLTIGTCFFPFMSEVSLRLYVLHQVKKPVDELTLPTMFRAGLAGVMAMQGLSVETIAQTMVQRGAGGCAKTDSGKTLGCMNDRVRCPSTIVEEQRGLAACDLTAIIQKINQMPQRTLDWGTACVVGAQILESVGVLTIPLDSGRRGTQRRPCPPPLRGSSFNCRR